MKQFLESANLLQTIASEAVKNSAAAKELVAGLSDSQLNWKPTLGNWSISQCLEHLSVSTEEFEPYWSQAIRKGLEKHAVNRSVPYRPTMMGGWLARHLLPEASRKMRAPKKLQPDETPAIHGALDRFLRGQDKFIAFVQGANGLDYNRTRLRSPVTALIRYSLADAFVITVVHCRRHLAQARRVKEAPGFPKS